MEEEFEYVRGEESELVSHLVVHPGEMHTTGKVTIHNDGDTDMEYRLLAVPILKKPKPRPTVRVILEVEMDDKQAADLVSRWTDELVLGDYHLDITHTVDGYTAEEVVHEWSGTPINLYTRETI